MAKLEVRALVKLYYGVIRKTGHVFELTDKAHFDARVMEWVDGKAPKTVAPEPKADAAEEARKEAEQMLAAETEAEHASELRVAEAMATPAEPRTRRRRAQA